MRRIAFGVAGVFSLAFTALPAAGTETVSAAADAQTSSAHPGLKFGSLPAMAVRQGPRGAGLSGYLRFDVSGLPAEPAVQSAVLRLWVRSVDAAGTIEVAPALSPWQEGTITAGSAVEIGPPVAVLAVEEHHASRFVDVELTSLVRDWMSGALENHGLALRAEGAGPVNVSFHTREGFLTSHVPSLELVRAADGPAGQVAAPDLTPRLPSGSVMFFDLTACPQGWSELPQARGRVIVGLPAAGTLLGTQGQALANLAPRQISGNAGVVAHGHTGTAAPAGVHTHAVTVSSESAHTHAVDHPSFDTAVAGTHTHTTNLDGGHVHNLDLGSGDDNTTNRAHFSESAGVVFSINTDSAGAHTHTVTTTGSAHSHAIDVPLLPASGPGSSHAHTATAGQAIAHVHNLSVDSVGVPSVDVTMPYVQLLVCRKN